MTIKQTVTVQEQLTNLTFALLDDAALFPPGNADMADAIRNQLAGRRSWYASWLGPFICPADRLAELAKTVTALPPHSIELALTVPGGPAQLSGALTDIRRMAAVRLVAVELPAHGVPPGQLASAAQHHHGNPIPVYAELPFDDVEAAATDLASAGVRRCHRVGDSPTHIARHRMPTRPVPVVRYLQCHRPADRVAAHRSARAVGVRISIVGVIDFESGMLGRFHADVPATAHKVPATEHKLTRSTR